MTPERLKEIEELSNGLCWMAMESGNEHTNQCEKAIDDLLVEVKRLRSYLTLCPECDEPEGYGSLDRATGVWSYECEQKHTWCVEVVK